jgi:hypothetical protein
MNKRGRPSIGHGTFSQLQALLNTDEKKLRGIMGTAEHGGRLRRMNHGALGQSRLMSLICTMRTTCLDSLDIKGALDRACASEKMVVLP